MGPTRKSTLPGTTHLTLPIPLTHSLHPHTYLHPLQYNKQVAATIGIAHSLNLNWAFPATIDALPVGTLFGFQGSLDPQEIESAYVLKEIRPQFYNVSAQYHSTFSSSSSSSSSATTTRPDPHAAANTIISLEGYYQWHQYFDQIQETLRQLLQIQPEILERVETELPEVTYPDTVALHVRRSDYLSYRYIYNVLRIRYYAAALALLDDEEKIGTVIVLSDDIPWTKQFLVHLPYKIMYSPFEDEPLLDFTVLARCRRLIMANSSFSWWAAYLKMMFFGNGTVVAPVPWYTPTGPNARLNSMDFYFPHWHRVRSWKGGGKNRGSSFW